MADNLNETLATMRQLYGEIETVGSLTSLDLKKLPETQAAFVKGKASSLHWDGIGVKEMLRYRLETDEFPFAKVSPTLTSFYEEQYLPNQHHIFRLGFPSIAESIAESVRRFLSKRVQDPTPPSIAAAPIRQFFDAALDNYGETLSRCEDEAPQYRDDGFLRERRSQLSLAGRLCTSSYFQPDEWLENLDRLDLVLSARDAASIPAHVRYRAQEVYRCVVFGHWLAVLSLSRSLLEYALLDRASRYNIPAYEQQEGGRGRPKRLEILVSLYAEVAPHLKDDMDAVREYGNEVMHPKKGRNIEMIVGGGREQSIDCAKRIRKIVMGLYA